jgi:transposase
MQIANDRPQAPTAIRTDLGAIFVSLELSRSTWLITSLSPGGGEKLSKHTVRSGDVAGLRTRFSQLVDKVQVRSRQVVPIIVIQEAGLDGFWIHRLLQDEGIESYVVDPASIATSRRRRRAKTDKIDGEALVRTLLAYKRGEPRVCAMVRAPTPHEEDCRRICRERKTLTAERIEHVNRIKGLLFAQGISDYEPLQRKRRTRLQELRTGDGRPLPEHLKAQIGRELDRLELTLEQIKSVETERDAMLSPSDEGTPAPGAMLKSQIQALDRTQPGLPMKKGHAGTMTHDYKRNGTTTLFAALDVLEGKVIGRCMQRHRHQEFIRFLNTLEANVPDGKDVHLILDNYKTHTHPRVRAWLARHKRFTFHFTPTSCSWLNAVEGYFAKLSKRRLKRGVFHSVVDLQAAISRFVAQTNAQPKPFVWTADPDKIIAAVKRGHQVLDSIH